jgi:hypothetical protein
MKEHLAPHQFRVDEFLKFLLGYRFTFSLAFRNIRLPDLAPLFRR